MALFDELKRRNVIRGAVLYLVASWGVLQVAALIFGVLGVPNSSMRLLLGLLAFGFPLAIAVSWFYAVTPAGLHYQYAQIHAQWGETANAFRWLEVAEKVKDPGLILANRDPLLDPIRQDARFARLVERLGLAG